MEIFCLKTPVVLLIFNRPDLTKQVFDQIAKVKPNKLFIISDGPRNNIKGEIERVNAARSITQLVDWTCEIKTNYSNSNLGCKNRISSGIDWVFQHVEEAIFLEDDCLPSQSFFLFCDEMIKKYRKEKKISMISGINFQKGYKRGDADYYFSKYAHIWGWATWKDRWINGYDVDIKKWPEFKVSKEFHEITGSLSVEKYWDNLFERVHRGEINTWDYQWLHENWRLNRISIIPNKNLISNIGFRSDATHTKIESELANLKRYEIEFPIIHPNIIERDYFADNFFEKEFIQKSFLIKLYKFLKKKFR